MFLLTTVSGLHLPQRGRGESVVPLGNCSFTDDQHYLEALISADLAGAMGSLEYADILMGNVVTVFSRVDPPAPLDQPLAALSVWQHDLLLLSYCLWLIRDNSLNLGVGFAISGPQEEPVYSSNSKAVSHTLADGTRRQVAYSLQDFRLAGEYFSLVKTIVEDTYADGYPDGLKSNAELELGGTVFASSGVTQLTRAKYTISCARATGDLGFKIAGYVMFLEILFSTSTSELSHKLSERVAFFLGRNAEDRLRIFEEVKLLYSIRSKLVHGDVASAKQTRSMAVSARRADQLVREIMTKIIHDPELVQLFDGSAKARERYFTELALGVQ